MSLLPLMLALGASTADVTAPAQCVLSGSLVADGAAAEAVTVELRQEMDWLTLQQWSTKSRADGAFEFPPVGEGYYRISVAAPGRVPAVASLRCGQDVRPGPVKLVLTKGTVAVRGRVTDREGGALAGTSVTLVEVGKPANGEPRLLRHNAYVPVGTDGRYAFSVIPGHVWRVFARADGYHFQSRDMNLDPPRRSVNDVDVHAEQAELDFQLAQEAVVRGVVTFSGKPVAGATVTAGPRGEIAVMPVKTDAQGRFRLPVPSFESVRESGRRATPPAALHLSARTEDAFGQTSALTLHEGEDSELTIRLAQGRTVSGTLLLDGQPLPFASVSWYHERSGARGGGTADLHGEFRVSGLPNDAVELRAVGGKFKPVTARAGVAHVTVPFVPKAAAPEDVELDESSSPAAPLR